MGALADAVAVLKDVLRMRDDLDRLSKNVDKLADVANDLELNFTAQLLAMAMMEVTTKIHGISQQFRFARQALCLGE